MKYTTKIIIIVISLIVIGGAIFATGLPQQLFECGGCFLH